MVTKERIFGLDLLRATAVLLVVFHHSLSFVAAPLWLNSFGWIGEIGVGGLLVLSGYLIGQGLIKKCRQGRFSHLQDLRDFYVRRWVRTLPPYYFYLFLMAALCPSFIGQLLTHKSYFFFLQNFAWNTPAFYCQTWTLALLEFFYLLFPLLLFLTSKISPNRLICLGVPMVLLFSIPMILRAMHPLESAFGLDQTFRRWVVFRLDTPIIGVAAALVQAEIPLAWAWLLRNSWFGFGTFSLPVFFYSLDCPYLYSSHWLQVIFYPACALALAPLLPWLCNWKFNHSLLGNGMSAVSQASYSLYVSHYFAFIIGLRLLQVFGVRPDQILIAYPLYIIGVVLITSPTYFLAEEPFIRLREHKSQSCWGHVGNALGQLRAIFAGLLRFPANPVRPLSHQPRAYD